MKRSWKTTTGGIVAVVAAVLSVVKALIDDDPTTNPNWEVTITAISAGLGLIFARDNNVSSEDAGAK